MITTPCQAEPEMWVGDNPDDREYASRLCAGCPLIVQCYDLAIENGEEWGVWGGVDLRPGSQRRTRIKACVVCAKPIPRTGGRQGRTCPTCAEAKPCQHCGNDFPRTHHSAKQWAAAKFCGKQCATRNQRAA